MTERKSEVELRQIIRDARVEFTTFSVWKHRKSGVLYIVDDVVMIEETCEPGVVYQQMIGADNHVCAVCWVRPAANFREGFERA